MCIRDSKLADIVNEYQYLVEVDHALGQNYRNLEDARKDLANRFKYQRIPCLLYTSLCCVQ